MGPKLRRAGRDAMRDQEIAKSLSARSVEVAREVLRIGRGEMAQLIGVSLATALNYETGDGQIRLYQWKRVEAELIARGLLGDFERRLQRHELALAARRAV